jgi:hypothetical protein
MPGLPSRYADPNIRDMNDLFGTNHLAKGAFRMRTKRPRPERFRVGKGHVVKRYPCSDVPFKQMHRAKLGPRKLALRSPAGSETPGPGRRVCGR